MSKKNEEQHPDWKHCAAEENGVLCPERQPLADEVEKILNSPNPQ